jgi:hypothetical protein
MPKLILNLLIEDIVRYHVSSRIKMAHHDLLKLALLNLVMKQKHRPNIHSHARTTVQIGFLFEAEAH